MADWLIDLEMLILNYPNHPTHDRGAVLDIAIASPELFFAWPCSIEVRADLALGSDHDPVLTIISGPSKRCNKERTVYNLDKTDSEQFATLAEKERKKLYQLPPVTSAKELDNRVWSVNEAMHRTLKDSTPVPRNTGKGQRWWDASCDSSVKEHRHAQRAWIQGKISDQVPTLRAKLQETKKLLRRKVRLAKRGFYQTLIAGIRAPRDILQAAKWAHKRTRYGMPPLKTPDGQLLTMTDEKISLLLQTHTTPPDSGISAVHPEAAHDNGHGDTDSIWSQGLTEREVKDSIFSP